MYEWLEKFKIPIALSVVGVVLIIGGVFASNLNSNKKVEDFPKESLVKTEKEIVVDVSGAVNNPGVYKLKEGARVEEAILAAGGITETASGEYISKYLNMAQKISDGTKIYIPVIGESVSQAVNMSANQQVAGVKIVSINTSTQAELEALPGIGPVSASKIINGRPYNKIEELLDKKIVGKATFEKIKNQISN